MTPRSMIPRRYFASQLTLAGLGAYFSTGALLGNAAQGPEVKFCSVPNDMQPNRPPSEGLQFFGVVRIDGQTRVLTVTHFDAAGKELWSVDLEPGETH